MDVEAPQKPKTGAGARPLRVHLEHIDGLRGIAALLVVVYHLWIASGNPLPAAEPLWWHPISHGYTAVHLFLVVSGFCVCWPYIAKGHVMRSGQFALRRALRLLPPYLASLVLFTGIAMVCTKQGWMWPAWGANTQTFLAPFLTHAALIHNFFPPHLFQINPAFWSLALEAQLYLTVPLLLFLATRLRPWAALAVAFAVSILCRYWLLSKLPLPPGLQPGTISQVEVMVSLPGRWFEFALGMGAAYVLASGKRLLPSWFGVLVATGAFLGACWLVRGGNLFHPFGDPLFGLAACLVLVAGAESGALLNRLLTWSRLTGVGQISFSIYLMHEPFVILLATWAQRFGKSPRITFLLCVLPALALCLALGALFYRLIEAPSHRLAKRLGAWRDRTAPVGLAPLAPVSVSAN